MFCFPLHLVALLLIPLCPMNMSDHRKYASMKNEDFILEVKIRVDHCVPVSIFIRIFLPFNLSNQIKDVGYELLLYKCSCLVNRKDDIFQLMFLFIEQLRQICFLSSHDAAVLLYFCSSGIVFFPFIISVQKVMLCQAKHICYSPSIVGFINTTTFITQQVFSLHHSLSQFVFYWYCQYRSSLSSGF